MSTRPRLDFALATLRSLLIEMSNLVDEQFADAMNALMQGDTDLAEQVIARDDAVDQLELKIDEQCERILALHAPVAADLRMLITAVKINTDLERIGDHCRNLSRNTWYLRDLPDLITRTNIPRMADMARCMLRDVEVAFLEQDRLKARKVIARDLQVNRLHEDNFHMMVRMCREERDHAEAVAHLLTASKALERISDHAKNIAQSVVFMIEGNDIRHRGLQASGSASASDRPSSNAA